MTKSIVLFLTIFLNYNLHAQNYIEVPVRIEILKGDYKDVRVKVSKNEKDTFSQSGAHNMRFSLDLNHQYLLEFSKPGYISRVIEFNTSMPLEALNGEFKPFEMDIILKPIANASKKTSGINKRDRIAYSPSIGKFEIETSFLVNKPIKVDDKVIKTPQSKEERSNKIDFPESTKITREDFQDGSKTLTLVKVEKDGIKTLFSRVKYPWGGIYFFKNSTVSISENLFREWTGINQ